MSQGCQFQRPYLRSIAKLFGVIAVITFVLSLMSTNAYAYAVGDRVTFGAWATDDFVGGTGDYSKGDTELAHKLFRTYWDKTTSSSHPSAYWLTFRGESYYTYNEGKEWWGRSPLTWIVVDSEDGYLVLVTEKVIRSAEAAAMGDPTALDLYGTSSSRKWLVNFFYKNAFSNEEKQLIGNWDLTFFKNGDDRTLISISDPVILPLKSYILNMPSSDLIAQGTRLVGTGAQSYWLIEPNDEKDSLPFAGIPKFDYIQEDGSLNSWYSTYTHGYRPMIKVKASALEGSSFQIQARQGSKYKITSAKLAYNGGDYEDDVLSTVREFSTEFKDSPIQLRVAVKAPFSDFGYVELVQKKAAENEEDLVIATALPRSDLSSDTETVFEFTKADESTLGYDTLRVGSFKAGKDVVVKVYDGEGDQVNETKLSMEFKDPAVKDLAAELSIGGGFETTIKNVPFLGQISMGFDAASYPIDWEADTEGNFKATISYDGYADTLKNLYSTIPLSDYQDLHDWQIAKAFKGEYVEPKKSSAWKKDGVSNKPILQGYIEGTVGSTVFKGAVVFGWGWSFYKEIPYTIGPIPMVLEPTASLKIKGMTSANFNILAGPDDVFVANEALDFTPEGGVGIYTGAGIPYACSVGIYGKGSLDALIRIYPWVDKGLYKSTLKGDFGLKAKVLGRDLGHVTLLNAGNGFVIYNRELPKYEWDEGAGGAPVSAESVATFNPDESYPLIASGSSATDNWLYGERQLESLHDEEPSGAASSAYDTLTLASNVYSAAAPRLVQVASEDGNKTLLFFIDSASDRNEANRPCLSYSVYDADADTWSTPVKVDDDGTADFGFDVSSEGGYLSVVWQDAKGELLESNTIDEIAHSVGVSFARYQLDGSTLVQKAVRDIDDLEGFPMMPRVADSGEEDRVSVSLVLNDNYSIIGNTGTNTGKLLKLDGEGILLEGEDSNSEVGIGSMPKTADMTIDGAYWALEDETIVAVGDVVAPEASDALNAQVVDWQQSGQRLTYATEGGIVACDASGELESILPSYGLDSMGYELTTTQDGRACLTQLLIENGKSSVQVRLYDTETGTWGESFTAWQVDGSIQALSTTWDAEGPLFCATVTEGMSDESDGITNLVVSRGKKDRTARVTSAGLSKLLADGKIRVGAIALNENLIEVTNPSYWVLDALNRRVASYTYEGTVKPGEQIELEVEFDPLAEVEEGGDDTTQDSDASGAPSSDRQLAAATNEEGNAVYTIVPAGSTEGETVEFSATNLELNVNHYFKNGYEQLDAVVTNTGLVTSPKCEVQYTNPETGTVLFTSTVEALAPGKSYTVNYKGSKLIRDNSEWKKDKAQAAMLSIVCDGEQTTTTDDSAQVTLWGGGEVSQRSGWSITQAEIESSTDIAYTGDPIEVSPVLTFAGETLEEGFDYELSGDTEVTEPGTYAITITGKNLFLGSRTFEFTVSDERPSIEVATVQPIPDQYYDGRPAKPTVEVSYNDTVLKSGVDYDLTYSDNEAPGTATVTITGKNHYVGSIEATYTIVYTTEGVSGECSWKIDNEGTLTIWPTNGVSGQLGQSNGSDWWNEDAGYYPWYAARSLVKKIVVEGGVVANSYSYGLFRGCENATNIDVSHLDVSKANSIGTAFYGCKSVTSLDVGNWDVSSATYLGYVFGGCTSLTSLDVSKWDTSSATDMTGMFRNCRALESVDVANWDTSHVTEMDEMFAWCAALKQLSLTGWETSQVTSCTSMYYYMPALEIFTVGSGVHFHGEFPIGGSTNSYIGNSYWWSSKAEKWIGYDEIASTRSGIADTYTKKEGQGKPPESEPRTWKRLAGSGRYDTMAAIVQEGWKSSSNTVIVATGNNFKDALSAAGLAGLKSAPVVLTDGGKGDKVTKLSPQAKSELQRLAPRTVYVVGGPFAVSDAVMADIQATLPSAQVDRVSGSTAASTSAAIATEAYWDWEDTAIIATNKSFKDALSVAPLSYAKHWPILLADNGQSLNADVVDALKQCGIKQVYIVGGKLAVTDKVESQLIKAGVAIAGRLAGLDGVHTSRAIADFAIKNGLSVSKMAFATSQNFPDALAGAALCGKNNSVLLLCDAKAQYNLSFAKTHKDNITTGYVFGGTYAFSESLFKSLP